VALETLAEEIYEVNPERSGVTSRDLLLYFYYGGMVYAALKNWNQAMNFFGMVSERWR
jgi:COP9 signalosome complex subunit 3